MSRAAVSVLIILLAQVLGCDSQSKEVATSATATDSIPRSTLKGSTDSEVTKPVADLTDRSPTPVNNSVSSEVTAAEPATPEPANIASSSIAALPEATVCLVTGIAEERG